MSSSRAGPARLAPHGRGHDDDGAQGRGDGAGDNGAGVRVVQDRGVGDGAAPVVAEGVDERLRVKRPGRGSGARAGQCDKGCFDEEKQPNLAVAEAHGEQHAHFGRALLYAEGREQTGEDQGRDNQEETHAEEQGAEIERLRHGIEGLLPNRGEAEAHGGGVNVAAEGVPERGFVCDALSGSERS